MLAFVALIMGAIALGGCATVPVTEAQAKSKVHKRSTAYAKVRGPAARRVVVREPIPLPDRALLKRQPEPDCAFRGPVSSPMTAEEIRQKLDYEQQCYRQAESNVRGRLNSLQDAVIETIEAVETAERR